MECLRSFKGFEPHPITNHKAFVPNFFWVISHEGLECLKGLERLNGWVPLSNNLSFGNLLKMFLVIPKEGLETLECLKSSKCLELPSNYLTLEKLSKMHFDMTK